MKEVAYCKIHLKKNTHTSQQIFTIYQKNNFFLKLVVAVFDELYKKSGKVTYLLLESNHRF